MNALQWEQKLSRDAEEAKKAWLDEKDPDRSLKLHIIWKEAEDRLERFQTQQVAGGEEVRELSEQACQQLLEVEVAHLPGNAEDLQTLLESGMVPVTQVTFRHVAGDHSQILTAGQGQIAQHFGLRIASGFANALGHAEEATAHITLTIIVDTWDLLWRYAPLDRQLDYSWGNNQGLGSVDSSAHDPSTGRVRPDLTIVASQLLLFVGEEKTAEAGLEAAYADIEAKFEDGLSPIYYQHITFIPFMIAAGNKMRFGMLHRSGECELCSHTLDVTLLRNRITVMQIAINLYRLLLVLVREAPDPQQRAVQNVPERRPENTTIIRHRFKIEKIILFFDEFLERFGHSFEDIKAAYEVSKDQVYMVHANCPKLSRPRSAGIKRLKGSSYYKIHITRPGAHSPRLVNVTETQMKQVMLAGLRCAQLLASSNLVHRDLRLANFFWDEYGPFVGDLELAAKAPLQVSGTDIPRLTDWTDDTLDAGGSYTTGSDVHQLGVLLWKWLSLPTAASADSAGQASDLVKVLKSKTDAHAALDHAWLNSVPETSSM